MKRAVLIGLMLAGCHRGGAGDAGPPAIGDPLAVECLAGNHGKNGTYCSSAATFYELEAPPKQDLHRALELWQRACDTHEPHPNGPEWPCLGAIRVKCKLGSAPDCVEFGKRLEAGVGGARANERAAQRVFAMACDAGSAEGCALATTSSGSTGSARTGP